MMFRQSLFDRDPQLDLSFQKGERVGFFLLATIQVTLVLGITVIAIALPSVADELGLPVGQLALISAGYGLAFSGLLLLGGRLADLLGQRRILVIGLVAFGSASVTAASSVDFWSLFVSRLAQGAGAALAAPAAMALLAAVFSHPDRYARAVALWGGLAPIGASAGILLSGIAVTVSSWRWAFALPAVVAVVAVFSARRVLPPCIPAARARLDVPGSVLVTVGVVALSYGLVNAGDHGWTSPTAFAGLLGGLVALGVFVAVEARVPAPLVPLAFVRSSRRVTGLAALMVAAAGHASIGFFLALYLQEIRGFSAIATTAAFLPLLLMLPLAAAVAAQLLTRFHAHAVTATGMAIAAAGLLLVGQLSADTPYVGTLLIGLLIFPIGAALTLAAATVLTVEGTPTHQAGLAGGLVNTAVELGPTVGLAALVGLAGTRTARLLETGSTMQTAVSDGYAFALTIAAAGAGFAAAGVMVGHRASQAPDSLTHIPEPTDPRGEL